MKGMLIILPISKDEAFEMRKRLGNESVKMTHTKHPRYYLVEDRCNLKELKAYRKSKIIKTKR